MFIRLNETITNRKRVPIHLVSSTDGLTALTGQTGNAKISINYAAPSTSVNIITEVDATNMPGDYYLDLDTAEINTLGTVIIRVKTASSAEYVFPIQVIMDDPFAAHTGPGLLAPGSGKAASAMRREDMIELAKMVWNVILENKNTAKDVLLRKSEFDATAEPVTFKADDSIPKSLTSIQKSLKKLESLEALETLDEKHEEVLSAINSKEIPNHADTLDGMGQVLVHILNTLKDVAATPSEAAGIKEAIAAFTPKIAQVNRAVQALSKTSELSDELLPKLTEIQGVLSQVAENVDKKIDIEKRFASMSDQEILKQQKAIMAELSKLATQLHTAIINSKYDILKNQVR